MPPPGALGPAFSADAFSLTPDPARLFLSRDHGEALARLRHGLESRRGFVVMVGEVGTGKTTLAYALLTSLGPNVRTAYVANTRLPFEGLLRLALADFGAACEARERDDLLRALRTFLAECAAQGQTAVLVVDEAQSLDDDTFESLRELEGLPIILLGQPELDEKLRLPRLRAIADLVAIRVDLAPLDEGESRRYIAHRLTKSGGSLELFSPSALRLILRHAGGVPRRMNILCHNALLLAFAAGAPQVTANMVREAIYELRGGTLVRFDRRPSLDALIHLPWWRHTRWGSAGIAGLAVGVMLIVLWRRAPEPSTAAPEARPPVQVAGVTPPITEPQPPATTPPPTDPPPTTPPPTAPPPTAPPPTAPPPTAPPPTAPPPTAPPPTAPPPTTPPPTTPPPTTPPPAASPPTTPPPAAAPQPAPAVEVASLPTSPPPSPAAPAAAPSRGVSDAEVRAFLDRYVRSWRTRDVTELRRIGQVADERQAQALAKYFESVGDLDVEVNVLEISGSGDRRTVRFTRRDRFRDPAGREISKESPPIEKTIVRTPDGLKFAPRS